jgi:hypothetical protein
VAPARTKARVRLYATISGIRVACRVSGPAASMACLSSSRAAILNCCRSACRSATQHATCNATRNTQHATQHATRNIQQTTSCRQQAAAQTTYKSATCNPLRCCGIQPLYRAAPPCTLMPQAACSGARSAGSAIRTERRWLSWHGREWRRWQIYGSSLLGDSRGTRGVLEPCHLLCHLVDAHDCAFVQVCNLPHRHVARLHLFMLHVSCCTLHARACCMLVHALRFASCAVARHSPQD